MIRFATWPRGTLVRTGAAGLMVLVILLTLASPLAAQVEGLASQSLRGYWHVFAAYALAWILLLGWLVAVFRRLGRLERELDAG